MNPEKPSGKANDFKTMADTMQKNLDTMHKYFDLLFGKDMDELIALFADDINWLIVPTNTTIQGTVELRALAENHWSASPDRIKRLLNLFANDEYASLEYISGGTLEKSADFKGTTVEATGKAYELQCCFVFHFNTEGRIDKVREYFDMATVQRFAPVTGVQIQKKIPCWLPPAPTHMSAIRSTPGRCSRFWQRVDRKHGGRCDVRYKHHLLSAAYSQRRACDARAFSDAISKLSSAYQTRHTIRVVNEVRKSSEKSEFLYVGFLPLPQPFPSKRERISYNHE
jgi:steroid delta-isomerase-like uncharacterized protein